MAKTAKVNTVDISAAVELVTDTKLKTKLEVLEGGYTALVSEVIKEGTIEGTILYVPGVTYKTLRGK